MNLTIINYYLKSILLLSFLSIFISDEAYSRLGKDQLRNLDTKEIANLKFNLQHLVIKINKQGGYIINEKNKESCLSILEKLKDSDELHTFLAKEFFPQIETLYNKDITIKSYNEIGKEVANLKIKSLEISIDHFNTNASLKKSIIENLINSMKINASEKELSTFAGEKLLQLYKENPDYQQEILTTLNNAIYIHEDIQHRITINQFIGKLDPNLVVPPEKIERLMKDRLKDWKTTAVPTSIYPATITHFQEVDTSKPLPKWTYILHSVDWKRKKWTSEFSEEEQESCLNFFLGKERICVTYNDQDHTGIYSSTGIILDVPRENISFGSLKDLFSNSYQIFDTINNPAHFQSGEKYLKQFPCDKKNVIRQKINSICANPYFSNWGEVLICGTHPQTKRKINIAAVFTLVNKRGEEYSPAEGKMAREFALKHNIPVVPLYSPYGPPNHKRQDKIIKFIKKFVKMKR